MHLARAAPVAIQQGLKMKQIPTIKTVMTPFPYSVAPDEPLGSADALMKQHQIRHLPVKDGQMLVGVVTERDITLLQALGAGETATIVSAYRTAPYVVDLSERLDKVAMQMAEHHIDCALVTKNDKLVGIFTNTDACRQLALQLRGPFMPGDGNEAA